MSEKIVEVRSAVVRTYEGEKLEVEGGAWLSPEAWLSTEAELERLRAKKQDFDKTSMVVPTLMVGAAILGAVVGYWIASDDD
ncbi:MAG: hypothetical protein QM817_22170 [Archangium sp.]